MTETNGPRRRGRPPGSKNRPKPAVLRERAARASRALGPVLEGTITNYPEWKPTFETTMEEAGYASLLLETSTIRVVLSAKRRDAAFGDPGATEEMEVDWPAGWRLPQTGETVHLRKDWGGLVNFVDFDLAGPVVRIFLR